jgi:hypothetical protein
VSDPNGELPPPGLALVALPSVELIAARRGMLEMFAVAAGVFALVQSLLLLDVPPEALWVLVLIVTMQGVACWTAG